MRRSFNKKRGRKTINGRSLSFHRRYTYYGYRIMAFTVVMVLLAVLALMLPLRPSKSNFEKRELARFPQFRMETLLNGEYFKAIDLWFSDTFPFRDGFINANSQLKSLYGFQPVQVSGKIEKGDAIPTKKKGKPGKKAATEQAKSDTKRKDGKKNSAIADDNSHEKALEKKVTGVVTQSLGAVLVVGDSGYEYYNFSREVADEYIDLVSRAGAKLKGKATVYDMIIPTSMDITLPQSFRKGINSSSQKDAIQYMNSSFEKPVKPINVYTPLKKHAEEYIYFRTDHHWTSLGAYYAYVELMKEKKEKPVELKKCKKQEFKGFLGAFYSDTKKNPALKKSPDTVVGYTPPGNIKMVFQDRDGNKLTWPLVSDVSKWAVSAKYSTFIGGDNPYTIIKNKNIKDGSSCLVIKESFGNAFVPFLPANYGTVHVIDYRYWDGNIVNFVKKNKVKDVLFLNNVSATRNKTLVGKMDSLVP